MTLFAICWWVHFAVIFKWYLGVSSSFPGVSFLALNIVIIDACDGSLSA